MLNFKKPISNQFVKEPLLSTKASILFSILIRTSWAQDRSPTNQAYLFAADAETFLYEPLKTTFSCQGRDYGYYADVDNNCQVRTAVGEPNTWHEKQ